MHKERKQERNNKLRKQRTEQLHKGRNEGLTQERKQQHAYNMKYINKEKERT